LEKVESSAKAVFDFLSENSLFFKLIRWSWRSHLTFWIIFREQPGDSIPGVGPNDDGLPANENEVKLWIRGKDWLIW
jgi:hypothetical protein